MPESLHDESSPGRQGLAGSLIAMSEMSSLLELDDDSLIKMKSLLELDDDGLIMINSLTLIIMIPIVMHLVHVGDLIMMCLFEVDASSYHASYHYEASRSR